ncbi:serine protease 55-like [Falco rusticolus]|uniref:serine protease 55-like n=1 Tax=Falco rusticolus TaxID=120794 RepID=UPI0018868717|nr:serine protease 55-like [Falco rusticolus]XP_055569992.1 serine protease 55 [Falco cherrug]
MSQPGCAVTLVAAGRCVAFGENTRVGKASCGVCRSTTALNVVEVCRSRTGIEMLCFTLLCFAFLIGSINAECGLRPSYEPFRDTGKMIAARRYAKAGEFPWHVSIQSKGKHICGGTIISRSWILTAAHCFGEEVPPDLTVAMGGNDLSLPLEEHKPESLIIHEGFDNTSMENDIALILLSFPIQFSNKKIPICLPFMYNNDMWQHCWVAGWGTPSNSKTAAAEAPTHVLQKARMKLVSREQCLERIPPLMENVLCAELEKGERGPCQVNSGGPLVCGYWSTMKWFQVGIVSWGEDCAVKPNPQILVSVYSYHDWIEKETARRGKPFFTEGMDNHANAMLIPSGAGTQLAFLEFCLLLFISLGAIRLL